MKREEQVDEDLLLAVRKGYESWNTGDAEAFVARAHPEIVWESSGIFPGTRGIYRGREELAGFFRTFVEPWERLEIEMMQIRQVRPNEVLVWMRFRGVGREDIEVERDLFNWLEVEGDLLRHMRSYDSWDEAEAAAAAG